MYYFDFKFSVSKTGKQSLWDEIFLHSILLTYCDCLLSPDFQFKGLICLSAISAYFPKYQCLFMILGGQLRLWRNLRQVQWFLCINTNVLMTFIIWRSIQRHAWQQAMINPSLTSPHYLALDELGEVGGRGLRMVRDKEPNPTNYQMTAWKNNFWSPFKLTYTDKKIKLLWFV